VCEIFKVAFRGDVFRFIGDGENCKRNEGFFEGENC
jgi:hypothetical protein